MKDIAIFLAKIISNLLNPNKLAVCRFSPSCTSYAEQSIRRHGITKGFLLTSVRLLKCQPLYKGGFDPVP